MKFHVIVLHHVVSLNSFNNLQFMKSVARPEEVSQSGDDHFCYLPSGVSIGAYVPKRATVRYGCTADRTNAMESQRRPKALFSFVIHLC